jgi:quinol monooxygenase YgiN
VSTVLHFERHTAAPGKAVELLEVLSKVTVAMRTSPGVLWAEAAQVDGDGSILLLSEWRTAADLEAYASGSEARELDEEADPLRQADPTRRAFQSSL